MIPGRGVGLVCFFLRSRKHDGFRVSRDPRCPGFLFPFDALSQQFEQRKVPGEDPYSVPTVVLITSVLPDSR